jgi:hypothetical protein
VPLLNRIRRCHIARKARTVKARALLDNGTILDFKRIEKELSKMETKFRCLKRTSHSETPGQQSGGNQSHGQHKRC